MEKLCSKCKKLKPRTLEYFYSKNTSSDGLASRCKKCISKSYPEQRKNYRIANKEKLSLQNKNTTLLRKYGITLDSYDESYKTKMLKSRAKLTDEAVITAFGDVKSSSLRKVAKSLGVNHETLRQRFFRLGLKNK